MDREKILESLHEHIAESISVKEAILANPALCGVIATAAEAVVNCYERGHRVLIAGNGGSAADAQHIAAELVNKFYFDRPAIDAVALTTNTSVITAVCNDLGYDHLFSRQVEALGRQGDIFIAISTSGTSENILRALESCRKLGIFAIGMTGMGGGRMRTLCDLTIEVPSSVTPRIQEAHIMIGHILCSIVEESLFGPSK